MTLSDQQRILFELLRQQYTNPWIIAIFSIIGAAIGSYGSSYLRTRGENKAVEENFKAIRQQLSTTTRDTEEIKQQLSTRTWRSQQQWAARERYYTNLLDHLYRFKTALESLFDYYLEPGSEQIPDQDRDDTFKRLTAETSVAYSETCKLVGPAAIFLSAQATTTLEELFKSHWDLTNFAASCNYEYIEGASKMADDAYRQILMEARVHLGITGDA